MSPIKDRGSKRFLLILVVGITLNALVIWLASSPRLSHFRNAAVAPGPVSDSLPDARNSNLQKPGEKEVPGKLSPFFLDVYVQDRHRQAIAGAKLQVRTEFDWGIEASSTNYASTDEAGTARIGYSPENLSKLEVSVSHEEYGSRQIDWSTRDGEAVPASYIFVLGPAVTIGGYVVDENDSPIPNANLAFSQLRNGFGAAQKKGEHFYFPKRSISSDGLGAWQLKGIAEELLDRVGVLITHPDFVGTNFTLGGVEPRETQLRAGTYKTSLHRGEGVHGLVTDEAGNPISGAKVSAGRFYLPNRQETKTDSLGVFTFSTIAAGEVFFSAMAEGFVSESKGLIVKPGMKDILFHLKPGATIRGVVRDEASQPIADVRISEEMDRRNLENYWSSTTSADGRFEWKSAPDERASFVFGKQGYAQIRNETLTSGADNIVILRKAPQFDVYVMDAETGSPVTKFRYSMGQTFGDRDFFGNGLGLTEHSSPDGYFTITSEYEFMGMLHVAADDYASQNQLMPKAKDSKARMEFRLKHSPGLRGIVLSPEGVPIPDVQVAFLNGRHGSSDLNLNGNRLVSFRSSVVLTDESGKFVLNSPHGPEEKVFAVGALGYGLGTVEQIQASGKLVLEKPGKVQGVLRIGGVPSANQSLALLLSDLGVFTDFHVNTDEQGNFEFAKVPAGEVQLVRVIKTSEYTSLHSHQTSVTVQSGQTTYVTLGDSGALIRGSARLQNPPEAEGPLTITGLLRLSDTPSSFNSARELDAFFSKRAQFGVAVNTDGSFVVDSVPPGNYTLSVSAQKYFSQQSQNQTVASKSVSVTVPENPNPLIPLDVPELVLDNPASPPDP